MSVSINNNTPIRIAISGVSGNMGRQLIRAVTQSEQVILGAALTRIGSGLYGVDAGELACIGYNGVAIQDNLQAIKHDFDILIDFTSPEVSLTYLDFCRQNNKKIIIGTTGFSEKQKEFIRVAAQEIGIIFTTNFSIGINLMLTLLKKVTQIIGEESDIEIIEKHHRNKIDAPSGTALEMGEVIARTLGNNLAHYAVYGHERCANKHKTKSIGFASVRAADIVGEHTVMFAKIGECLEITHKVSNRMIFASEAVNAAVWLSDKKKGLFDMINILNLDKL